MTSIPLLDQVALICVIAVVVSVVLARLKLPAVTVLLAAGALAGPYGLGLVEGSHAIEMLAEVGVVLLLFTIGLELSLDKLRQGAKQALWGGLFQIGATALVTLGIAQLIGYNFRQSVFLGFLVLMSSTAIVLRALGERGELDAPHGRFIVTTLILQDLFVVPAVLLVPLLAHGGSPTEAGIEIGKALGKALLLVLVVWNVAKYLVPRVLRWVDATRSRESFLMAVIALCMGTAWLTYLAGLSLALGAFLGGAIVADTDFRHRAMTDVMPLRDIFISIFFVSLGMLFDVEMVIQHPVVVTLLFMGFLFGKGVVAGLGALLTRLPARSTWLAGVGLAQFGEFGFVLIILGQRNQILDAPSVQVVLSAGIASMFATPLFLKLAPRARWAEKVITPLTRLFHARKEVDSAEHETVAGHIIVIGFGVAGKMVVRALSSFELPHRVLEMNARTVRFAKQRGIPIEYADATSTETLRHLHIEQARAVVVVINDPGAAMRVVDSIRRISPEVPLLIRTRYMGERQALLQAGATDVVADEVEGGAEMVMRLSSLLEVPRNLVDSAVERERALSMQVQRPLVASPKGFSQHRELAALNVDSVVVHEDSRGLGRSVAELELRSRTNASVVAIRDAHGQLLSVDPKRPLSLGDVVFLAGSASDIDAAIELIDTPVSGSFPTVEV